MLATGGPIRGLPEDYAFEPKWDGWRAIVTVHAGRTNVRTRTGRDVTEGTPELVPIAEVVGNHSVVLDGELVAHDGHPRSFYRVGARVAARSITAKARTTPLTFIAFDVVYLDDDLSSLPYLERRSELERLSLLGPAWCTSPSYAGAPELFAACTSLGLEGLVAKRLDSRYSPGQRSTAWVKAKCAAWLAEHAQFRHERRPGGPSRQPG